MTTFDDEFASDAYPDLVAQFGDETTYRPSGGGTRTIDAIIVTNPVELQAVSEDAPAARCLVRTLNSATRGILASEIVLGRDKVDVDLRDGEAMRSVTIKQLVSDNGGVTTVACY